MPKYILNASKVYWGSYYLAVHDSIHRMESVLFKDKLFKENHNDILGYRNQKRTESNKEKWITCLLSFSCHIQLWWASGIHKMPLAANPLILVTWFNTLAGSNLWSTTWSLIGNIFNEVHNKFLPILSFSASYII